jgi:hypothetical protein
VTQTASTWEAPALQHFYPLGIQLTHVSSSAGLVVTSIVVLVQASYDVHTATTVTGGQNYAIAVGVISIVTCVAVMMVPSVTANKSKALPRPPQHSLPSYYYAGDRAWVAVARQPAGHGS